jgi:hypothetical protein
LLVLINYHLTALVTLLYIFAYIVDDLLLRIHFRIQLVLLLPCLSHCLFLNCVQFVLELDLLAKFPQTKTTTDTLYFLGLQELMLASLSLNIIKIHITFLYPAASSLQFKRILWNL